MRARALAGNAGNLPLVLVSALMRSSGSTLFAGQVRWTQCSSCLRPAVACAQQWPAMYARAQLSHSFVADLQRCVWWVTCSASVV
jgi:hypothetical protein